MSNFLIYLKGSNKKLILGAVGNIVYSTVLRARRMRFYRHLSSADKIRYDRVLDTHVIRTAVPMPAANAEKLIALVDAGVLSTVRLGYGPAATVEADGDGFRVAHRDASGSPAELYADCVVRASAQDFGLERHPPPLVANLLRRGEIVPHAEGGHVTGGIALSPGGHRVTRADGSASPALSSFGAPVRFWQNENNYAGAFVDAAALVADEWTKAARRSAAGRELVGTPTAGHTTRR